jgi:hypothetical protein
MKGIAIITATAITVLASTGVARAQESVSPAPASPVHGGKVLKSKTMTAVGDVKTVTADSLAINDGPGKDWTFVIDAKTKVVLKTGKESVNVTPASPIEGGTVIPTKQAVITDIKEGQRVRVTYREVDGKMHATQVRVL